MDSFLTPLNYLNSIYAYNVAFIYSTFGLHCRCTTVWLIYDAFMLWLWDVRVAIGFVFDFSSYCLNISIDSEFELNVIKWCFCFCLWFYVLRNPHWWGRTPKNYGGYDVKYVCVCVSISIFGKIRNKRTRQKSHQIEQKICNIVAAYTENVQWCFWSQDNKPRSDCLNCEKVSFHFIDGRRFFFHSSHLGHWSTLAVTFSSRLKTFHTRNEMLNQIFLILIESK